MLKDYFIFSYKEQSICEKVSQLTKSNCYWYLRVVTLAFTVHGSPSPPNLGVLEVVRSGSQFAAVIHHLRLRTRLHLFF